MYPERIISGPSSQALEGPQETAIDRDRGATFTIAKAVRSRRLATRISTDTRAVRPRRRTVSPTSGRPEGDNFSSAAIPPLDFSLELAAHNARLDRIELFQSLGFIYGNTEEMQDMRASFGSPANRFFTSAPQLGRGRKPLKIRKGHKVIDGVWVGKPLLKGRLNAIPITNPPLSGLSLSSSLTLNPTRAIRNRPEAFCESFHSVATSSLFAPHVDNLPPAPTSRNGNDNVLPVSLPQADYQRGELSYLLTVQEGLLEECRRVARNEPSLPYRESISATDFSLGVCEVYFEVTIQVSESRKKVKEKTCTMEIIVFSVLCERPTTHS